MAAGLLLGGDQGQQVQRAHALQHDGRPAGPQGGDGRQTEGGGRLELHADEGSAVG
jgi:hypothetical protein